MPKPILGMWVEFLPNRSQSCPTSGRLRVGFGRNWSRLGQFRGSRPGSAECVGETSRTAAARDPWEFSARRALVDVRSRYGCRAASRAGGRGTTRASSTYRSSPTSCRSATPTSPPRSASSCLPRPRHLSSAYHVLGSSRTVARPTHSQAANLPKL